MTHTDRSLLFVGHVSGGCEDLLVLQEENVSLY